jgi:DNA repair protein RecN (Recombination protein N)
MLRELKIQNYALIQNMNIEFDGDFSVLTGETGAGKSILLGALSLVLGVRADSSVLQNNDNKCVVEAIFDISKYGLESFFENNDLDYELETLIRREINTNGKSRAFINDTPVTLNTLKELAGKLIDIHSQHQSLELNDNNYQLKIIDSIAENGELLDSYKNTHKQFKQIDNKITKLKEYAQSVSKDYDYNTFQYKQLHELNLEDINQEQLENELNVLNNIENIQQNLSQSHQLLSAEEVSILDMIRSVKQNLSSISSFYSEADGLIDRVERVEIELKDISQEIEVSAEDMEANPNRYQQIKDILDELYSVMQKHQVDTVDELMKLEQEFLEKTEQQDSVQEDLAKLEKEFVDVKDRLEKLASKLSKRRADSIPLFVEKITHLLTELGMPSAKFEIKMQKEPYFNNYGIDKIVFLFSANKNYTSQNITKIASGGEISRLMLSIKSILSESTSLPTIIFDEIDTGVSGDIADKMAFIMKEMAKNMQVISITHLPQIAAQGKNHYKIYKKEEKLTVNTYIAKLTEEERVEEIARLLSGKNISKEAIENAKTLMN